ncbi:MAG: phosphate acyltransferase PlsX [Anaerolineales bacterium]
MRIVLDAMGSDTYPDPEIKAAAEAAVRFDEKIILVGNREILKPKLETYGVMDKVELIHAPEVLEMSDKPAQTARGKALNSMAVGMDLLKSGEGDAFITAGNTGGAMANGLFRLGRIRGVKRPALTGVLPVRNGQCIVLDIGANADCRPEYLLQFALMGSIYAEKILKIKVPRLALMSNGEEEGKGNELVKSSYELLKQSKLNFIGNVESKEIYNGGVDVVVTDGFTGNVFLKTSEAVAKFMISILKENLTSSLRTTIGAALAKPAFDQIRKVMDPGEIGAVPLLGIDGLVFVAHGRSDSRAMFSAIRAARQAVEENLLEAVKIGIQQQSKSG